VKEGRSVLVTGASGFIGQQLVSYLSELSSFRVVATARYSISVPETVQFRQSPELGEDSDWGEVLSGLETVIHLAGRAHVLNESSASPLELFRKVNCDGTLSLARQALAAGVRRFVFISSIGVNGYQTISDPFNESSLPEPHADYALSKLDAEQGLRKLVAGTSMKLVLIRPSLVYAAHAPGNFQRLLKLVASGMPLPFALVKNQRSMVALENLVDFIALCIEHPAAANELFLISDGVDVSTPEIIRYLSEGMGQKTCLLPVPNILMRLGASLIGKQVMYTQLCGSLVVDCSKARNLLGWKPRISPAESLIKAGRDFKKK